MAIDIRLSIPPMVPKSAHGLALRVELDLRPSHYGQPPVIIATEKDVSSL
jgi:hypothetical protein